MRITSANPTNYKEKIMIIISKEEAAVIRRQLPKTSVTVASRRKNSRGHTYYMEENGASIALISKLRGEKYEPRRMFFYGGR